MNNLMGFLSIEAYTPLKRGSAAGVQFAVIAKPGTGATPAKSEPGSVLAGKALAALCKDKKRGGVK